ncbi:MAG: Competence protein A [Firmicutes bacterium ADurb.Bin193]|nr:MAG: Competence protein A [Firmicutes bacterium ADurb.Bin193]
MFNKNFAVFEFGCSATKLIVVSRNNKGVKIKRMELIPTAKDSIQGGEIKDAKAVADSIKQYLSRNGIRIKKAIITITAPSVIMREIQVLNHKKSIIKSFLEIEAPNYFPIDLSKCVVDYKIIPKIEGAEHPYRILVTAVPSQVIDGYMEVSKLLGLDLMSIDVSHDSIVKLYSRQKVAKPEKSEQEAGKSRISTAFVDISNQITGVTIETDNIIKYNKVLSFGTSYIDDAFSNGESGWDGVPHLRNTRDLFEIYSNDDPQGVDKIVKSVITDFLDSLTAFFDFHESRGAGNKVDNIILFGAGASMKGLEEIIRDTFSANVSRGFAFDGVSYASRIDTSEERILQFYKCIGACVKPKN